MQNVLLAIHLLLAVALVGVILIQRSEGGGLGIGGGGGGQGGFLTTRGTANLLTRITSVLAALFICTSLALAILAAEGRQPPRSIIDPGPASSQPAAPTLPQVPLGR